jgi:hypothetical protein
VNLGRTMRLSESRDGRESAKNGASFERLGIERRSI